MLTPEKRPVCLRQLLTLRNPVASLHLCSNSLCSLGHPLEIIITFVLLVQGFKFKRTGALGGLNFGVNVFKLWILLEVDVDIARFLLEGQALRQIWKSLGVLMLGHIRSICHSAYSLWRDLVVLFLASKESLPVVGAS